MAKPQPIPPRPSAPPAPEAPLVTSVMLGRTADKRHAAAILKTRGNVVVSCALVCPPTRDAELAEEAWRDASYPALYHGQAVPTVEGPSLVEGTALAMVRTPANTVAVIVVEVEAGKVLPPRKPEPKAATEEERLGSHPYEGRKLDAWDELMRYAAHYVLRESFAQSRRRAAGG